MPRRKGEIADTNYSEIRRLFLKVFIAFLSFTALVAIFVDQAGRRHEVKEVKA